MTEQKLDIFQILERIHKKDTAYYGRLSEEEQKQIQPFVLMRWLSGGKPLDVVLVNELVNPYAFDLTKHKDLLWYLLTVVGSGRSVRCRWIKGPSKKSTGLTHSLRAVCEATGYSSSQAIDALDVLSPADVVEMAESLGWSADDVAKVKKEMKAKYK